jgi:hypothetical protein
MNKTELKKFAVEARRDLLEKVALKAEQYGITKENSELTIEENYGQLIVNGKTFPLDLKHALRTLQNRLNTVGYEQLIEEVAYTWFNRIIAIRYMEVNNYLPDRVNVLSSSSGKNEPDILLQYETMNLDVGSKEINILIQRGENEQAYRKLFVAQCNSLNKVLPTLFEKINDYTELLLPDYLLDSEFIISKLVSNKELTESFNEVEVIGWLYQYYNSEPKDKVYAKLKRNGKVLKEEIPAVTQLFTPKWVVKYLVENSLGQLWLEANPSSELKNQMHYFVNPAEQDKSVIDQLNSLKYKEVDLENLKVIDPCVGSGHMLIHAFDLLYEMYIESGYISNEIPKLILEKNLYGLDIDNRAVQLASFALLMKARSKSRRVFRKNIKTNIFEIKETNHIDINTVVEILTNNDEEANELRLLLNDFIDGKNKGSLINCNNFDYSIFVDRVNKLLEENNQLNFNNYQVYEQLEEVKEILQQAIVLSSKYDVTVTNPPYMGGRQTNKDLGAYLKKNYPDTKSDIFAAMMQRMEHFVKENGFIANVTMQSWMFLSSFEKFRKHLIKSYSIYNMVHMDNMVMGIAFGTAATIYRKKTKGYKGTFQYVKYDDIIDGFPIEFPVKKHRFSIISSELFDDIPGSPIAYWSSINVRKAFKELDKLGNIATPRVGLQTGDNNKFLRLWHEVKNCDIGFNCVSRNDSKVSGKKWFPYNKGGAFRKWYGNQEYVVNWYDDGNEIRNFKDNNGRLKSRPQNMEYYFKEGLTWSFISSSYFGIRYTPKGFLFDVGGSSLFPDEDINIFLSYLASRVAPYFISFINPTLNFQVGNVASLPLPVLNKELKYRINKIVKENIDISKFDWDSFEISWKFNKHPFIHYNVNNTLSAIYKNWNQQTIRRFNKLKEYEGELNEIFINYFDLQDELTPEVDDDEITITLADRERDSKSFISYFIGCVMGRYSLDVEGLAFAGGEFDDSKYKTFKPNSNGLILLTDDHYFENDIIVRLREFLSVAFSPDTVDENMQWLAESLEMKKNESPEERLRRYFLDEFFKEHCKTYQKRPIYWLVDSGKQKGLRTLIYMHRYQPDTMATIRFDHLQEIQAKYQNEIEMIDTRLANPSLSATDRRNLEKAKIAYQKKIEELQEFDKHLAVYANEPIEIDLDDGVKVNYAKFDKVLAKIK